MSTSNGELSALEAMRRSRPDAPHLSFEEWRNSLCLLCGRFNPEQVEPNAFDGWARPLTVFGLAAVDLGGNVNRVERTHRDTRLDGADHYSVVFQAAGQSTVRQNDQAVQLAAGDAVLVDLAQPVTYFSDGRSARWIGLHLPRKSLVTHLGFEPSGGSFRRSGPLAGRLLYDVAQNAITGDQTSFSPADSYMQLVVYDLVGALVAADPWSVSGPTDKLFNRIRRIIRGRFADPEFGPPEVAAEAGISLRYVQKLFMERGSTCSAFILSVRLDHAAQLLQRRPLLGIRHHLTEVAYACGFGDYSHFARLFRSRFGCSPGAHAGQQERRAVGVRVRVDLSASGDAEQ